MALLATATAQLPIKTWIQLSPTGGPPAARYWAGNAYDAVNDRLILFSGEDYTGLPRPTDVWVLTDASGIGGTPNWVQLVTSGEPPLGREGGTTVYDPSSNSLIIHGGCTGNCSPALQDVWVLSNANGLGGTPTWTQLPSNAPIGRAFHTAVYDSGTNRMIIFGGNRAFFNTSRNDVWVLTNANGTGGTPQWIQLSPTGPLPPPREYTAAVYDQANNRMIIFGGAQSSSCCSVTTDFNDVWVLTNANGTGGTPQWIQLSPTGPLPAARQSNSLIYDSSNNQMVLFGGVTFTLSSFFNDVWVLTNANGTGGTPQWNQVTPNGSPPLGRFAHSVGYSSASQRMIVAMGRNDQATSPLFNDVWVLLQDTTPPVLNLPSDLEVEGDTTGGANVTLPSVTATDDIDPAPTVTCNQSSGFFSLGTTIVSCTATDASGNSSNGSYNVIVEDTTAPDITCPSDINGTVGQSVSLGLPIVSDIVDPNPVVSNNAPAGYPPGTTTVTWTAADASGNLASCMQDVTLIYNFSGFFDPVDNPPTLNSVKAGRSIPIKFSLNGDYGLDILAENSPLSQEIFCDTNSPMNEVGEETVTAGNSSLTYDADSDLYHYVWKTDKSWAETCRQLTVRLTDGTEDHVALFEFK